MSAPLPDQSDIVLMREEFVSPRTGCYVLLRYYRHAGDIVRVSIVRRLSRTDSVAVAPVLRDEQWTPVVRNAPRNWQRQDPHLGRDPEDRPGSVARP
jgi:hypothetical protein